MKVSHLLVPHRVRVAWRSSCPVTSAGLFHAELSIRSELRSGCRAFA